MDSTLIVVGGLPGAGKSTLADALAESFATPVFTKDQIEATLWRQGITAEDGSSRGAEDLMTTLAREQLHRGQSAIFDTVARLPESRSAWRSTAEDQGAVFVLIECICSDLDVHRGRIEGRVRGIPGWYELSWADVQGVRSRYQPWAEDHLVLDAVHSVSENLRAALEYIQGVQGLE